MGRLHDLAIQRYAEHYGRVGGPADPRAVRPYVLRTLERTFGALLADLPEGSPVLDIGCGTGYLLYWLSRHRGIAPVGVDASASQLEVARAALPSAELHLDDAVDFLRARPGCFAGVFCMHVLEHLPDEDQCLALAEAARAALRPGGFLVCAVPNAACLVGGFNRYVDITHHRIFTEYSLFQLLEVAGLRDCRVLRERHGLFLGRVQAAVARALHSMVFLACGCRLPASRVFSRDIQVVGFRKDEEPAP